MGQQEIEDLFRDNPERWFVSSEIHKILGGSISCVTNGLKKMRNKGEIFYKKEYTRGNQPIFHYKFKP